MPWEPLRRCPHEGAFSDDFQEERETNAESSMAGSALNMDSGEEGGDNFNMARSEAST